MPDRIAEPWGPRTPYAAGAEWPVRRDTFLEPGGMRTDFAGTSTTIRASRPEYDATVAAISRYQREYNTRPALRLIRPLEIRGQTEHSPISSGKNRGIFRLSPNFAGSGL